MKKRFGILIVFLMICIIISSYFGDNLSELEFRIQGAIVTISVVIILWIGLAVFLLKSEPKQKKVNMSDRYVELSSDKLKVLGVDYKSFKKMLYQKFNSMQLAMSDFDYDKLKLDLTDDLYKYYVNELDNLKRKGYKNIIKDLELINLKIYNIRDIYDLLHVDVYLNVRMYDYIINSNTKECIYGDPINKMDFEFELTFINNGDGKGINQKYVLSKKSCINKMQIKKT